MIHSLLLSLLLVSGSAIAAPTKVDCQQRSGQQIELNNEQVLQWKKNSATEFIRSRAHISGSVVKVLPVDKGIKIEKDSDKFHKKHQRFLVQIGPQKSDLVEVFYNGRYAPRPTLKKGDKVEACGEFVADSSPNAKDNPFAIVYWVHSAKVFPHTEGYLNVRGKVFGHQIASQ